MTEKYCCDCNIYYFGVLHLLCELKKLIKKITTNNTVAIFLIMSSITQVKKEKKTALILKT